MGLAKDAFDAAGLVSRTNTLADYCTVLNSWCQEISAGVPVTPRDTLVMRKNSFTSALNQMLVALGKPLNTNKDNTIESFGGKKAGFLDGADKVCRDFVNEIDPPVAPEPRQLGYDAIKANVTYLGTTKGNCEADAHAKTKIASLYARGSEFTGHGPTTALGKDVMHCHVGNGDGLAFKWVDGKLTIVAVGVKWDKAPKGNSGYKWTK